MNADPKYVSVALLLILAMMILLFNEYEVIKIPMSDVNMESSSETAAPEATAVDPNAGSLIEETPPPPIAPSVPAESFEDNSSAPPAMPGSETEQTPEEAFQ